MQPTDSEQDNTLRDPEPHCTPQPRVITVAPYGAPRLHPSVWIAPGAVVVGAVTIDADSSVWYNAVVRADSDDVTIGARSNVQDGVVIHTHRGHPANIGNDVSIGHNAVVHGATIDDHCLIGMNATVLSGARIGAGSLIAAGALVREGMQVPPRSLVAGIPGRVVRELNSEDDAMLIRNAEVYLNYTQHHRTADASSENSGGDDGNRTRVISLED